ncbi:DHH family phosphoesterase [endosymbiont GvMRE of Glomus versiforme]|uniref:DHH family phosphoesterase n=1 Tax=endosymbiont GvMRE of Glomus versiforme TaxID=2039283 RepID=UPI0011C4568D|nr:bifunctional oligoribonuclease/PAP phosphatase NrnA [endosymbiont GvMRE of Glomus versiforme]
MKTNICQKIINKIKKYDIVICLRHIDADGDAYGSAMALAQIIRDNFPQKKVFTDGKNNESLSFLGKNGQLIEENYWDSLVIVCDTANQERIDSQHWKLAQEKIKIDHHLKGEKYADYEWVDSTYSATCEMVGELAMNVNLKISKEAANFLLLGIITDSGRFLYSNTTSRTLQIAAFLLEKGADLNYLCTKLYQQNLNLLKFKGYVLNNFTLTKQGTAFIKITLAILKKYNINQLEAKSTVNILANTKEIKVWLLAIEKEEELIKISIRSSQYIINEIAEKYNGGGHKFAAGAKIKNWTELDNLIADLDELVSKTEYKV